MQEWSGMKGGGWIQWKRLSWTDISVRAGVCTLFSKSIPDDLQKPPLAETLLALFGKEISLTSFEDRILRRTRLVESTSNFEHWAGKSN